MRARDQLQTLSPFWRLMFLAVLGVRERRFEELEAENEALASKVRELEKAVAHHDGQLRVLSEFVPKMMRRLADTDVSTPPSDRQMH